MVAIGDNPDVNYGIAYGRERRVRRGAQQSHHDWLQILPLRVKSNRALLTVKGGQPLITSSALVLLDGRQISDARRLTSGRS